MEIESIFLNVWLSYSTFMEELAIIPNTIGSMRKKPNSMANINKISNDSFAFTTIIVKGTGNIHAANNVPKTNFFRFTFINSANMHLSNPLTPCNPFKVILQTVITDTGFKDVYLVFH